MNRIIRITTRALLMLSILSGAAAFAQNYAIDWHTVDGGGEMWSAGGTYQLGGTIGQPDANTTVMTGGTFELQGGFWPGTKEFCAADFTGDGNVNFNDLAALLAHYNMPSGATHADGDADLDGDVDFNDLAVLLAVYGTPCP